MRKYLVLIIALFILLVLTSCREDEGDKIAQREIRDILYDVSVNFNLKDIMGILDYLPAQSDPIQYKHKGKILYHFNQEWNNYMSQFALLEIDVLHIEVNNDRAVAHIRKKFTSAYETLVHNDPEDNGDISYFGRYNGNWYIYGNQQWFKKR